MNKTLAFRVTCSGCNYHWIQYRDKTWNVHCLSCGDKATTKSCEDVWVSVEEYEPEVHFD